MPGRVPAVVHLQLGEARQKAWRGPEHAAVLRLSPTGALVPGFGSSGHTTTTPAGAADWYRCAMTEDARGRLAVTGGQQQRDKRGSGCR